MFKVYNWWFLEINSQKISKKILYTDRNWVFNWLKLPIETILSIRQVVNKLNSVMLGNLKVISNESEDDKQKVLNTDLWNWLTIDEKNYILSSQSAWKFVLDILKSSNCYFIWWHMIWKDLENIWLNVIDISKEWFDFNNITDIPVIFARPNFAINAKYNSDNEINENFLNDISFKNLLKIIKLTNPKIVFCHTKPNCTREKNWQIFRELNLWFYFELLIKKFWYKNWYDIFDLWKWDYWTWYFFDMWLWVSKWDYNKVIWIGDMLTDIEYTIINWWTWILVSSWDWNYNETVLSSLKKYWTKFFHIIDLSYLKII